MNYQYRWINEEEKEGFYQKWKLRSNRRKKK